nr:Scr1 family TA system antitoxin-like transcriptional regulator [Streptacidiphilus sp. P02-A3a]
MGIAAFRGVPTVDIEGAVASRVKRQETLSKAGHRFVVLVEEPVLYNRIGDPDVMQTQLTFLAGAMRLPSPALGVIPFTADRRSM